MLNVKFITATLVDSYFAGHKQFDDFKLFIKWAKCKNFIWQHFKLNQIDQYNVKK